MKNSLDLNFRKATLQDIEQMVPLIIQCLKGPTGETNYEVIFGISRKVLSEMISSLLVQPITGHEFHYANYMVCEQKNEIISICCGWSEGSNETSSESIRSNLIASFLGKEIWQNSFQRIQEFEVINIPRQSGFLYLENASTLQRMRRKNVAYRLVYELIKQRQAEFPELEIIHSHVYLSNQGMYDMFMRFQYTVEIEKRVPISSRLNRNFPVKGIALVSIPINKYLELFEKFMNIQ